MKINFFNRLNLVYIALYNFVKIPKKHVVSLLQLLLCNLQITRALYALTRSPADVTCVFFIFHVSNQLQQLTRERAREKKQKKKSSDFLELISDAAAAIHNLHSRVCERNMTSSINRQRIIIINLLLSSLHLTRKNSKKKSRNRLNVLQFI